MKTKEQKRIEAMSRANKSLKNSPDIPWHVEDSIKRTLRKIQSLSDSEKNWLVRDIFSRDQFKAL